MGRVSLYLGRSLALFSLCRALRYLHEIAEDLVSGRSSPTIPEQKTRTETTSAQPEKKRGRKRKCQDSDDDVDFVVSEELLQEEEEREAVDDNCVSDESEDDPPSYNMNVFTYGEVSGLPRLYNLLPLCCLTDHSCSGLRIS